MINLNSVQKEAILHQGSPLLVLAGAGTGKTRVLTERIIYLVNSYLADPRNILAVTFTNKAAKEIKYRIANKIGDLAHNIWAGTFHSIATRILKRHCQLVGLKEDFTIIDMDDSLRLLKQIIVDFGIGIKEFPAKSYQYQIFRLKDKGLLPDDCDNNFGKKLPKFLEVYGAYQRRLLSLNCADFGDLLLYNLKIFTVAPDVLSYYQGKFEHILVDEYQDTNNVQYRWLLFLAAKHKNICAVGDDDQSIYGWRGAEITNILRFEKDFAGTKVVRLEQNYRSTGNILKVASHLIGNNKDRHDKVLWCDGEEGEKVKLLSFFSDREEARGIADVIGNLRNSINLNNIAILVRAGYQTRSFEEAFMADGLSYRVIGGLKFYDRREIKDAIAYLRVIHNFADDLALERIINVPRRGVGGGGLIKLRQKAADERCPLFLAMQRFVDDGLLKGKSGQSLKILVECFKKWRELVSSVSLVDLVGLVLEESGYVQMWKNEKTPDAASRVENLQEFVGGLTEFESLAGFLEHVSLVSGSEKDDEEKEMVNIMTVHSAKGLEFEVVFVPGLEEGVFPSGKAIAEIKGVEEERRLFYVAITRAQRLLYLSWAQSRFVFGQMQGSIMSSFLRELPDDVVEGGNIGWNSNYESEGDNFVIEEEDNLFGKRVFHQKFGYGKVLEIDGEKLKIKFEKSDVKMVMKDFISL